MKENKILIISHNPFSSSDNMGKTMINLFKNFEKKELCQLFFHKQNPNFEICSNYFRINETSVLKSIINHKKSTGEIVEKNTIPQNDSIEVKKNKNNNFIINAIYQYGRKRTEFIYLLRNLVWLLGKWKTRQLINWVESQKPTCIFVFAGDYSFLFNIAIYISEYFNIPIYTYFVDEYYLLKEKTQHLKIDARTYRKKFEKIVHKSNKCFCISEEMCKKYEDIFNVKFRLLMNPYIEIYEKKHTSSTNCINMYYFGNLSFNRWKNLSLLSTKIFEMNKNNKIKINFEIYSGESNNQILKQLKSNKSVNFMGKISQDEIKNKIQHSDILVHTEDFSSKCIDTVKYSISTKIPELLSSNRLILAIGPEEVESINYLKRNNAAIVISNIKTIDQELDKIYKKEDFDIYIKNAIKLANKNHNNEENYSLLKKYLFEGDVNEKNTTN